MAAGRPSEARVGWATFSIAWVPEKKWPRKHRDKTGLTDPQRQAIEVRLTPGCHPDHLREVLVHELLHALHETTGLNQQPLAPGQDREEQAVSLLAGGLLALLRDNPRLARWLTAE